MSLLLLSTRGRSWFAVSLMCSVGDGFALNEAFAFKKFFFLLYSPKLEGNIFCQNCYFLALDNVWICLIPDSRQYNLTLKGACFVTLRSTSLLVLHKINLFLLLFSMCSNKYIEHTLGLLLESVFQFLRNPDSSLGLR